MMNLVLQRAIGATVLLALATPIFAETADTTSAVSVAAPPAAASGSDWTGGYAGLQIGYADLTEDLEGDDVIGGITAGYDWDFGEWVVGFGADLNYGAIETDAGDLDSITRVKLRGGYDFGGTLLYATAGGSYASSEDFDDSWGYFGGVGLEHMLTDTISVTGEIAGHVFEDFDGYDEVNATTALVGVNYQF